MRSTSHCLIMIYRSMNNDCHYPNLMLFIQISYRLKEKCCCNCTSLNHDHHNAIIFNVRAYITIYNICKMKMYRSHWEFNLIRSANNE